MALTPVSEALTRVLNLCPVMGSETVPLAEAAGRVLGYSGGGFAAGCAAYADRGVSGGGAI